MTRKKKGGSSSRNGPETIRRLREFTELLESTDTISDKLTCRKRRLNLRPQPYDPERVRKVREVLGLSQALFAEFIGVDTSTVQKWEQGINTPKGSSARMMDEILGDPTHWRKRLKSMLLCESGELA